LNKICRIPQNLNKPKNGDDDLNTEQISIKISQEELERKAIFQALDFERNLIEQRKNRIQFAKLGLK
jgi:hypothetical protein